MNKVQIHGLILDYLDGNLDQSMLNILAKELDGMGYNLENLDELRELVNNMDQLEIPEPSNQLSERFYEMLDGEIEKSNEKSIWYFISQKVDHIFKQPFIIKLSYGLIMLVLGWVIGFWFTPDKRIEQMSDDIKQMKELAMFAMLDNPMASDRIQAVQMMGTSSDNHSRIIESLLSALNKDSDPNVRLLAAEALLNFSNNQSVTERLIYSVKDQAYPMVQIAIIDGLIAKNVKGVVPLFKELANDGSLNELVIERLNTGINFLI